MRFGGLFEEMMRDLLMPFLKVLRKRIQKRGFDIVRYNVRSLGKWRRMQLLLYYDIDLVFDVGANRGQYGRQLRNIGYEGRIVSFEPLMSAYNELVREAKNDRLWDTVNIALGNKDGKNEINVSSNSVSSSILDMRRALVQTSPDSVYVGKEKTIVRKIDSIIDEYYCPGARLFLKIDTQGYEKSVIEGAKKSLDKVMGMQLEMSLIQLYEGELLFPEMVKLVSNEGFALLSLEPGFGDNSTGQLLQVDGIFFRIGVPPMK